MSDDTDASERDQQLATAERWIGTYLLAGGSIYRRSRPSASGLDPEAVQY